MAILTLRLDLGRVLREVLLDLNSAFERQWTSRTRSTGEVFSGKTRPSPGTTATAVLIRDNYELVVGHINNNHDKCALVARHRLPKSSVNGVAVQAAAGDATPMCEESCKGHDGENSGRHIAVVSCT